MGKGSVGEKNGKEIELRERRGKKETIGGENED